MKEIVPGLAEAITARRRELHMNVQALVEKSGITRQGLAPLLRGERRAYQDRVRFGVCKALGWTSDSVDALLEGGNPTTLDDALASIEHRLDEIAFDGDEGERGEVQALRRAADRLRAEMGRELLHVPYSDSRSDFVKGLLADHDRANMVMPPSLPPGDQSELPAQVAQLIREARRLAELVEEQGAEIRQLRARLDQQPPSTGEAQS